MEKDIIENEQHSSTISINSSKKSKIKSQSGASERINADNYISNVIRYKDVMRTVNELRNNLSSGEKEISFVSSQNEGKQKNGDFPEQSNEIEKRRALSLTEAKTWKIKKTSDDYLDVKIHKTNKRKNNLEKLKEKLANIDNDELNVIFFKDRIENILSSEKYYFNDKIFENTVTDIFCQKFDLKKVNSFPFFNVVKSTKDVGFVPVINFQKITIKYKNNNENSINKGNEKKESCGGIESKEYIFFSDREYFPITFKHGNLDFFFLLEKDTENCLNQITIFFNKYKSILQRTIKKYGKKFIIPIYKAQNSQDYLQLEKEINDCKEKLIYLNDDKNNKENNDKKTTIENLKQELEIKQKEKFNESIALKTFQDSYKENGNNFKDEMLAILITESLQKELDGFYINEKKIIIKKEKNYTILPNSYILVEVKNHKKYNDILKNIKEKKKLIEKLGIDTKKNKIYFIGIIRDIINKKKEFKEKTKEEIEPDENENENDPKDNIIILTCKDLLDDKKIYYNYSEVDNVKITFKEELSKLANELNKKIDQKFDNLNQKMEKMDEKMDKNINELNEKINELNQNIKKILSEKLDNNFKK